MTRIICRWPAKLLAVVLMASLIVPAAAQDDFNIEEFLKQAAEIKKAFERIEQQFEAGNGKETLPELLKLLEHDLPGGRAQAAVWLSKLGPAAAPALSALERMILADDHPISGELFQALDAIGRPALPTLIKATEHEKSYMRYHALEVIGQKNSILPRRGRPCERVWTTRIVSSPPTRLRRRVVCKTCKSLLV